MLSSLRRKEGSHHQGLLRVDKDEVSDGDEPFIDENYLIREIKELKPLNLDSVCSRSESIKFALEVNQGWFAEKNIKIFNKIIVE